MIVSVYEHTRARGGPRTERLGCIKLGKCLPLEASVTGLARDSKVLDKSGKVFRVGDLAEEYGFTDVDGRAIPAFRIPDSCGWQRTRRRVSGPGPGARSRGAGGVPVSNGAPSAGRSKRQLGDFRRGFDHSSRPSWTKAGGLCL